MNFLTMWPIIVLSPIGFLYTDEEIHPHHLFACLSSQWYGHGYICWRAIPTSWPWYNAWCTELLGALRYVRLLFVQRFKRQLETINMVEKIYYTNSNCSIYDNEHTFCIAITIDNVWISKTDFVYSNHTKYIYVVYVRRFLSKNVSTKESELNEKQKKNLLLR